MDCEEVVYDMPFEAEIGGEYCFTDGSTLFITEFNVSYCPCDAQCVWQGETAVVGKWTDAEGAESTLIIHEELRDQNKSWTQIHDIALDKSCTPEVVSLELLISDPSLARICDDEVEIDEEGYDKGPKDFITIIGASITDDCLTISYSASGCSGEGWEVNLYDSGSVAESSPEQRYLRLSLKNPEECLAVFTKETSFDISNLQIENNGILILNLKDYEESLRYEY